MFGSLGKKLFRSSNDRELIKLKPIVQKINDLEESMSSLDKNQLVEKTSNFKENPFF